MQSRHNVYTAMDEGFGNFTAALKSKGMLDNSIILFTGMMPLSTD